MGGPCDAPIYGNTAEEMMNNGALHVTRMAESGDDAHRNILDQMKAMEQKPEDAKKWNDEFKTKFDAAPDNI